MANLQVVTIETMDGSVYKFPDVDVGTFQKDFAASSSNCESMTLVNASSAVLVLPVRIIRQLRIGEETLWNSSSV